MTARRKGKKDGRRGGAVHRDIPDESRILQALEDSDRGPLKAQELGAALGVSREAFRAFRARLDAMEEGGRLYRGKGQRYAAPGRINLVVGRVSVTRAGDAFIVPDEGERDGDVFVPGRSLSTAMDGDRVVVRIERRQRGRAPSGTVIKVLDRAHPVIVGTYREGRSFGIVVPQDPKLMRDIYVPPGAGEEASESDVVVVRVVSWGGEKRNPVGEIERVLGPLGAPGVDILSVIHGHGLPTAFPDGIEEEAERLAREAGEAADSYRVDRRELHVFTIDPADAKDHDDALSIEPVRDGVWEVGVHIADVSRFVPAGSPVDLEALDRSTSVYLVDRVIPMLPHALSSDACSLRPDEDRKTLSVFITIDEEGEVLDHRLERALIRSRHRLTYPRAQAMLDGGASIDQRTDADLRALHRIDLALRARREARGSLDFDIPEAEVLLGPEGEAVDIQRSARFDTHRLVESFMLLANETMAQEAARRGLPVLYRVHEPPARSRLEDLRAFLATLGHALPSGVPHATDLQAVLSEVAGTKEENLVSTVILRSMKRAHYDAENRGHFGLATEHYLHFTSPIRRYPDLIVHRALAASIGKGGDRPLQGEDLNDLAVHTSARERRADSASRETIELKKVEYMERHLGDEFDGTVSGVAAFGFFVLLDAVFVDGLVHVSSLGDDYYVFREEEYALVGERRHRRFRLGDRVRVRVARVNKAERKIDFVLQGGDGPQKRGGAAKHETN